MYSIQNRITHVLLVLVLLSLMSLIAMVGTRAYSGPLDPPGAPGSSDGVRLPGTPISSMPFTITQPGNYYVTRSLTMSGAGDGITISASDVTLDLGGFTLDGAGFGGDGIVMGFNPSGFSGIVVRNGKVARWDAGVDVAPATVEKLHAHHNVTGMRVFGQITGCSAVLNTGVGVRVSFGTVTDCKSSGNGTGFQIFATSLQGCMAEGNATGIQAQRSVVEGCSLTQNTQFGIVAWETSVVRNNTVMFTGSDGIRLAGAGGGNSLVIGNTVSSPGTNTGATGIYVETDNNRVTGNNVAHANPTGIGVVGSSNTVDGNSVSNSVGFGFHILGSKNTVVRNSAVNNGNPVNNYVINAGNNPGNVIAAATGNDWSNTQ